jgi:Tfp pilus assembly protein PilO
MKKQIPLVPVVSAAVVLLAVAAFFLVVNPKHDEAVKLGEEIAGIETKIDAARLALATPRPESQGPEIEVADLFRLAKAMPDTEDMPGVILEIDSIATSTGVDFLAVEPQPVVSSADYHGLPIRLTFDGSFFDLSDFLFRLRTLVTVRDGELDASGRLYTLDSMDLHQSQSGFPNVEAVLVVTAYSYGPAGALLGPGAAPGAPPAANGTQAAQAVQQASSEAGASTPAATAPAETTPTEPAPGDTSEGPANPPTVQTPADDGAEALGGGS